MIRSPEWHRISKLFLKPFQRTRILSMGFTISTTVTNKTKQQLINGSNDKSHENPGTPGTKLKVLKNNLKILCHPICNRLFFTFSLCSRWWLMLASSKAGELGTGTCSPFGSGLTHCLSCVHVYITPVQRLQSTKTRGASHTPHVEHASLLIIHPIHSFHDK